MKRQILTAAWKDLNYFSWRGDFLRKCRFLFDLRSTWNYSYPLDCAPSWTAQKNNLDRLFCGPSQDVEQCSYNGSKLPKCEDLMKNKWCPADESHTGQWRVGIIGSRLRLMTSNYRNGQKPSWRGEYTLTRDRHQEIKHEVNKDAQMSLTCKIWCKSKKCVWVKRAHSYDAYKCRVS